MKKALIACAMLGIMAASCNKGDDTPAISFDFKMNGVQFNGSSNMIATNALGMLGMTAGGKFAGSDDTWQIVVNITSYTGNATYTNSTAAVTVANQTNTTQQSLSNGLSTTGAVNIVMTGQSPYTGTFTATVDSISGSTDKPITEGSFRLN